MQSQPQLSWRSLLLAVVLVPVAVGVIPISGIPITLNSFVVAKMIVLASTVGLTLAAWALTRLPDSGLFTGRALAPLGIFLLVAATSAALGVDPRMAVFGDFEQGTGLLAILLCALALFLTTQLVRGEAQVRELTSVVIMTAAGIAVLGLLQQILLLDVLGFYKGQAQMEWMVRRGYSTIGNPDTYAAWLVLPALLALHRLRRVSAPRDRAIWGGAFGVILASCLLAQTRGPLVGLVVGTLAYAFAEWRKPAAQPSKKNVADGKTPIRIAVAVIAAAIGTGVLASVFSGATTDFSARFGSIDRILSLGGRLPLWRSAVEIASKHPLLGVGPDSFRLAWYPTRTLAHLAQGAGLVITDPHSVPLLLVATTGVLGLAAFMYLLGAALSYGLRGGARQRVADYTGWVFGLVALAVTMLTSMFALVLVFMLFLAIGVLIAPALHGPPPRGRKKPTVLRAVSVGVALLLVVFAGMNAVAQGYAASAAVEDARSSADRAIWAAAIAPWDTKLLDFKHERMVQVALEAVFTDRTSAELEVAVARDSLAEAQRAEPQEYLNYYRSAVLLIGVGEVLGVEYGTSGIQAGLEGLTIYPNSLELRTGLASGFLQRDEPARGAAVLRGFWDADPRYLAGGVMYVRTLIADGQAGAARTTLDVLETRFPGSAELATLEEQFSAASTAESTTP